ncbi:hypothetical protein QO004_002703 [Rhizobium mesoamericanum]|uniref:hypothetical protein n=1 Tax=Rhizobium mesoamericanum TaxID=1079800 RepID=UPI0027870FDA|nr:hypothetical protein [Rhizobium mesoamericanum]MDQ0560914.1 hypothetical protein [Rhizobium mesoamericanum]
MPDFHPARNHVDTGKAVIMTSSSFRRQAPGRAYDFLPPEPIKREARRTRPVDVADAEFVVITNSRAATVDARSFNDNSRPPSAQPTIQPSFLRSFLETFIRAGEAWLQQASLRTFAALVLALSVLVFGLFGGFSGLSQGEAASTDSALRFSHVTMTSRDANGMRVLQINGIIDNQSGTTQVVRPIRADLFAGEQLTASVVISPPVDVVYGGQSRGFSMRIQHAGAKMPEVRLSFMP